MLAALFGFTTLFAQDEVKTVNFTELLTPVNGEEGAVPFDHLFESSASWGDFNNDGYLDVLMAGIHLVPILDEEGKPALDDDGNPRNDWVKTTLLYKNNGDGTFDKVEHPFPHLHAGGIAWLDYDNDGNLDVFICGEMDGEPDGDGNPQNIQYSGLWRNLGESENYDFEEAFPGEFVYFKTNSNNNSSRIVAAGDYNNDGWVDIVIQGWSSEVGDRVVYLYRNVAGNYFSHEEFPVAGNKPFVPMNGGTVAWGDFNNDGYLDLLTCGYVSNNDFYKTYYDVSFIDDGRGTGDDGNVLTCGIGIIYINNGNGTFADPSEAPRLTQTFPYGEDGEAAWGDYNNDGHLDFYATGYAWWKDIGWDIGLYENKKDGTIERHSCNTSGLSQTQSNTMAWGDVNNDGFEDVVVTNSHNTAVFFNKSGDGTFSKYEFLIEVNGQQQTADHNGGTICLVDFDNDNDLDVFWNGYGGDLSRNRLLRNDLDTEEGLPVNQAPTLPTNLKAVTEGETTTFTWDASTDDLTPTAAINYNLFVKQGDVVMMVLPADLNTGRLKVNDGLAPISSTSYKISGLEGEYSWGVQAIDNAKNGSKFALVGGSSIDNPGYLSSIRIEGKKNAIEINTPAALEGDIRVYTLSGAQVYGKSGSIDNTTLYLSPGVYLVKVTSGEGVKAEKVIVQ